ncbi:MAG: hypothetical protein JXR42_06235 [Gammaproteobacteria bacterium]|nr:hypothetical protein [Gammaproteobacteria bacterium]
MLFNNLCRKILSYSLMLLCGTALASSSTDINTVTIKADQTPQDLHLGYRAINVTNNYTAKNIRIYGINLQGLNGKVEVCPQDGNECGIYHSSCVTGSSLGPNNTCTIFLKAKNSDTPLGKSSGTITIDATLAHRVFNVNYSQDLYAGGDFTTTDSAQVHGVAKWDGSKWSPLGIGLRPNTNDTVETLLVAPSLSITE